MKRKPTPPKVLGRHGSEEEKAETENDEQELVTVTKVVEEVRKFGRTRVGMGHFELELLAKGWVGGAWSRF